MTIEPGTWLVLKAGAGPRIRLRAVRLEPIVGEPSVWAATAEEWQRAEAEGREPAISLWPLASLEVLEGDAATVVVTAPDELDAETSQAFRSHVAMCFTVGARDVVVDLGDTRFVDSAGIGALIGLARRAEALGIELRLRHVRVNVATALRMSGAIRVLSVDEEEP